MKHLVTISELDVKNRRVFLRTDYNVVESGRIIDDFRIEASLPTLRLLLKRGCSLVLASHNGRPEGKVVAGLSLRPVAKRLAKLLKQDVAFVGDCVGGNVTKAANSLQPGEVLLLENLRFHPGEEANDIRFAKQLAELAETYVDDAFANIHRSHASMIGVPKILPHAAGLLVAKEYQSITDMMLSSKKPFVAVIGGAKVSDKIAVLEHLLKKVDSLLIGGAMANTFLYEAGFDIGASVVERDMKDTVKHILKIAQSEKVRIHLPVDAKVAKSVDASSGIRNVPVTSVYSNELILDIGTKTSQNFAREIAGAKQVFWNGTMGIAENSHFANGSKAVAKAMKAPDIYSLVGGGDTAAFVDQYRMHDWFDLVSTGGGATLEIIAGSDLPALDILLK